VVRLVLALERVIVLSCYVWQGGGRLLYEYSMCRVLSPSSVFFLERLLYEVLSLDRELMMDLLLIVASFVRRL
jgi:hypothetical protein